jgi:hypothetical protein
MRFCAHVSILKRVEEGACVSHEKLRNDTVDVNFVAFATYFDGPLTNDKRAADIYARAERSATGSLRHPAIVVIGERDRVGAENLH